MHQSIDTHHAAALPAFISYGFHIKAPNETEIKRIKFNRINHVAVLYLWGCAFSEYLPLSYRIKSNYF